MDAKELANYFYEVICVFWGMFAWAFGTIGVVLAMNHTPKLFDDIKCYFLFIFIFSWYLIMALHDGLDGILERLRKKELNKIGWI